MNIPLLKQTPTQAHVVKGTYAFVSLGCPKNTVDSERMLGKLAQHGYALATEADGADVVVVNTCGFIEPARQESLAVIREMLALKEQGRVGAVVVAGCLAERKKDDLLKEVPGVDHIVGVFGREEIASVVDRALEQRLEQRSLFRPAPVRALEDTARLRITPRHYAYLKISEGCDRTCTFCAIPGMRGKHVTKPIEEVLREARELVADGVRELIVVAQDTTYYGLDLYGRVRLAELLRELNGVEGLDWVRILYAYPIHFTDELLATLSECAIDPARPGAQAGRKIVPYLDLPLQHVNDRCLKRMQRRVNRAGTEELLGKLRSAVPGLALRTTFIVGFPGETEVEFEELLEFVLVRAGHASDAAGRTPAGGGQGRAARPRDAGAAGGRLRLDAAAGRPGAGADARRARPRDAGTLPGPQLRRRPGDRRPGAREGEEPAARRPGAGQGDRRRRLRPGRPGDQGPVTCRSGFPA
jgi:ribosomal protein S12 methylthiotransferase